MAIVINGSGTVTGLSVGGLPDGTVDSDTLASNAVVTGKIADGTIANADINDLAASKLTGALPAISGASLTGVGLKNADSWRLTTGFSSSSVLANNLERVDTQGSTTLPLGTGMTESSGVFTFPQTGIYLINFQITMEVTNVDDPYMSLNVSTDGGSSWNQGTRAYPNGNRHSSSTKNTGSSFYLLDVTNTSNDKVQFQVQNATSGATTMAATSLTWTGFSFVRLGDT